MTITDEPNTDSQTTDRSSAARRELNLALLVLSVIDQLPDESVLDPGGYTGWTTGFLCWGDVEDRDEALAFLRQAKTDLLTIGRKFGVNKVEKDSGGGFYTLKLTIEDGGATVVVQAFVPSSLTCETVETGEVEVIPAQPEQTIRKTKQVCTQLLTADEFEAVA